MTSASLNPVLRIASSDLHEHVASSVAGCLARGVYCDVRLVCGMTRPRSAKDDDESSVMAHKVVLSAVSPYLRHVSVM